MSPPERTQDDSERPTEITIGLAEDRTLLREGIKAILSAIPGMRVVAEAATGDMAVELASKFRPNVLVLDIEISGLRAASVIREVRRCSPQTHVVVLSMHEDADLIHDTLASGAAAYLSKTSKRAELLAAISSVVHHPDNVLLSVSRETFQHLDHHRATTPQSPLTDRELQVLRLTAQALTNAQIGSRLYIAEATVKRHLTRIYAKLGAVSRVDAIRKATTMSLIEVDESRPLLNTSRDGHADNSSA